MSISELSNTPVEVTLGSKKYLVSRMPISELYGPAEARIISDYKANMISIASSLQGKEKMQYLTEATKEIPKGSALLAAAQEYLGTPEGYFDLLLRALNKSQKVSEEEILTNLTKASDEEKTSLVAHLMGTDYETAKTALSDSQEENKKK